MSTALGQILLKLALLLLPALEEYLRHVLANPPPPSVPPELTSAVSSLLPPVSASEEVARQLAQSLAQSEAQNPPQIATIVKSEPSA